MIIASFSWDKVLSYLGFDHLCSIDFSINFCKAISWEGLLTNPCWFLLSLTLLKLAFTSTCAKTFSEKKCQLTFSVYYRSLLLFSCLNWLLMAFSSKFVKIFLWEEMLTKFCWTLPFAGSDPNSPSCCCTPYVAICVASSL